MPHNVPGEIDVFVIHLLQSCKEPADANREKKNLARQAHKQKRKNLTAPSLHICFGGISDVSDAHWARMSTESESFAWEWVSAECPLFF